MVSEVITHKDNPLSTQKEIDFTLLREQKLASFNKEFRMHQMVMDECNKNGFSPNIIFESAEVDLLLEVVSSNLASFICVGHVVDKISDPNLQSIPFKNTYFKWIIGIISKRDKQLDYLSEKFIYFMQESCKEGKLCPLYKPNSL